MILRDNNKTFIQLASGESIPAGELKVGDYVQGSTQPNKVLKIEEKIAENPLWIINGELYISEDTLIMNEFGDWCAVNPNAAEKKYPGFEIRLLKNDINLMGIDGTLDFKLGGLEEADPKLLCLEFTLDGDHIYFANKYLLHNKGSSPAPSNTTTVSKTEPPAYLKPYLTDIAKQAQTAFREVPQGGFSGQLIAQPTDAQTTSIQNTLDFADSLQTRGFGQNTLDLADQQLQRIASGGFTERANNQYNPQDIDETAVINAAIQPIQERLQEDILPALDSAAISQGAFGGQRFYQEAAEQVERNFTDEATRLAAELGYADEVRQDAQGFESFQTNQELFPELLKLEQAAVLTTPELSNAGVQQELLPSSLRSSAGAQEQLFQQDQLDEAYRQYVLSTQTPFAGLDNYAAIVSGIPSGSITTGTGSAYGGGGGSNFLAGALGGGLGAYGLSTLPGLGALGGPVGIGAGAILGGLLG